jgi:hypothetical protein
MLLPFLWMVMTMIIREFLTLNWRRLPDQARNKIPKYVRDIMVTSGVKFFVAFLWLSGYIH